MKTLHELLYLRLSIQADKIYSRSWEGMDRDLYIEHKLEEIAEHLVKLVSEGGKG